VKTILIFQGGGALGAYECGAFQAIAAHIDDQGDEVMVVGGTSIGALNASIIASSYQKVKSAKEAAEVLKWFWTSVLPNSSLPIFPPYSDLYFPFADEMQRFLNVWTSVLWGNPRMFAPDLSNLSPLAPSHYDMQPLERTIRQQFYDYTGHEYYERGNGPRLIVTTSDVQEGKAKAFDSDTEQVTPEKVVACCSLPPFMPAKKVGKHAYWDGGLWSNTPLREVLNALQRPDDCQSAEPYEIPEYQIYLIDDHPRAGSLPQDIIGVQERSLDILLADKTDYDVKVAKRFNQYIKLIQDLYPHINDTALPTDVQQEIEGAYQEIRRNKRAILHIVTFHRTRLPGDRWSATGDFSCRRIEELIAQGQSETQRELSALAIDTDSSQKICALT
jgi:NTE family protein